MPPRWNENRLTAKLGIDYPIIQGPLGGLSSQKLTAAVSNFGALGSFGAHGLAPAPRPAYQPYSPTRFENQARALLDEKVPVFSFVYGIPPQGPVIAASLRAIS
jgi:nitronate monooxygenase